MGRKQQICIVLIILFSVAGIYTAVHLAGIHYKKPHYKLNLINALPFMEAYWDRDRIEKEVKEAEAEEALPEIDDDFDPYAAYMDEESSAYGNITEENVTSTGFVAQETCDISEGLSCTKVDDSEYSEIFGIAISIYGLAGYSLLILSALGALVMGGIYNIRSLSGTADGTANGNPLAGRKPNIFEFMMYAGCWIGFLFSVWLTYIEATIIHSFCPYCLASAATMAASWLCVLIAYGAFPVTGFFRKN